MLDYTLIEIFTTEETRYRDQPVADAVIDYLRSLKIAARCLVSRAIAGCDESGEVATGRLEILSYNLPLRLTVIVPAAASGQVLARLDQLVADGIIATHDLKVVSYKAANGFFPRQLTVGDVMTRQPATITADRPLSEAAGLLLSSIFTGLPVVDGQGRVVGVVTQGDLLKRGGLPLRLGLLAESAAGESEAMLATLAGRRVAEAMTSPAVTIAADRPLTEAVTLMLAKGLKRLPVTGEDGAIAGMLSRLDIFRTVMRENPDWQAFEAQNITVRPLRTVSDITRRDTRTVTADTPIEEVIRVIDEHDIQRVAVVDAEHRLLGIISDRDLLRYFKPDRQGLPYLLARLARRLQAAEPPAEFARQLRQTTAGEIMTTALVTVAERLPLAEAIALMADKGLKRLPVVDDRGRFLGMISRDSLLRTGYGQIEG
jgi:CBS domain-containing protein